MYLWVRVSTHACHWASVEDKGQPWVSSLIFHLVCTPGSLAHGSVDAVEVLGLQVSTTHTQLSSLSSSVLSKCFTHWAISPIPLQELFVKPRTLVGGRGSFGLVMRIRSLSEFHLIYQILSKHTEDQLFPFEDMVQGHGIETQKQARDSCPQKTTSSHWSQCPVGAVCCRQKAAMLLSPSLAWPSLSWKRLL